MANPTIRCRSVAGLREGVIGTGVGGSFGAGVGAVVGAVDFALAVVSPRDAEALNSRMLDVPLPSYASKTSSSAPPHRRNPPPYADSQRSGGRG